MSGPRRDPADPDDVPPTVTFTVGTVHGSNYNAGRDAHISVHIGDIHVGGTPVPALEIPGRLRVGLRHASLPSPVARDARSQIDDIDEALRERAPDRPRIARALERLTHLVSTASTVTAAGAALVEPMTGLAIWLGALGKSVLDELSTP